VWLDQTADDGLIPKFPPPSHLNETEFWGLKFFDATPFSSFQFIPWIANIFIPPPYLVHGRSDNGGISTS
jgi:hypothetical protein